MDSGKYRFSIINNFLPLSQKFYGLWSIDLLFLDIVDPKNQMADGIPRQKYDMFQRMESVTKLQNTKKLWRHKNV